MALVLVKDAAELQSSLAADSKPALVGFFGDFSQASRVGRPEFERFCAAHPEHPAYLVDVGAVKDAHPHFGVDAVPAVVWVKGGRVQQKVVGAQTAAYYERAFFAPEAAPAAARAAGSPRVTVYTTSTCPWCDRVKAYLRQRGVGFDELNVGRDPKAAQRMVARSGQQGVPQLDINGTMVVGFDRPRIDSLLGLSSAARP